jgi:hypothetical protein
MPQPGWLEVHVRASSIKDALDCAMRYEAKNLLGIRMPSAGIAHLGTAIHAGAAIYDQSVIDGKPVSHDEAVGRFVDTLHLDRNPEEPTDDGVVWDEDMPRAEAEEVGTKGIINYIEDIGSKRHYKAVEAKLEKFPVSFPDQQVTIILTGKTDRIRAVERQVFAGGIGHGITDLKSGKTRVSKAEKRVAVNAEKAQLGVYELIAEKGTGIPITAPAEIAGISTAKHASVATIEVHGTREALVGTGETPGVLDFLARMLRNGLFPPNPSSNLCSQKFCPIYSRCPYHD